MTVAGTLSPFDWGSHEKDMVDTIKGHSVVCATVCAMVIPFTAWKHVHFAVKYVGRSTEQPQYTRTVHAPCAHRV